MDKVQRRDFIKLSAAGVVGNSVALADPPKKFSAYERVSLGKSGLRPTRLIFGTGVRSWNRSSELLRKGRDYAVNVIRGAYERGIPKVADSLQYRFTVGDAYPTGKYKVTAVPPLALSDASVTVTPPSYTGLRPRLFNALTNAISVEIVMVCPVYWPPRAT